MNKLHQRKEQQISGGVYRITTTCCKLLYVGVGDLVKKNYITIYLIAIINRENF